MKYKIGDKVKIKSDLKPNKNYGGQVVDGSMFNYMGQKVQIHSVDFSCYTIIEDGAFYSWTDEMIEGLVNEDSKPFKDVSEYEKALEDKFVPMTTLTQKHLEAIAGKCINDSSANKAAEKCAEITKEVAIHFAEFYYIFLDKRRDIGVSTEDFFNDYLQKNNLK